MWKTIIGECIRAPDITKYIKKKKVARDSVLNLQNWCLRYKGAKVKVMHRREALGCLSRASVATA
jgi:hypothetical protein